MLRSRTRIILIDTGFTAATGVRRGKQLLTEVQESRGFLISYYAEPEDVATLIELAGRARVTTFTGNLAYAPGVELLEVGGHTPGQLMVKVRTSLGPVLLASDAVHFTKELWEDRPFTAVTDLPGLYAGLARVRELVRSGEVVRVLTGHDPEELEQDDVQRTGEHSGVIAPLPPLP